MACEKLAIFHVTESLDWPFPFIYSGNVQSECRLEALFYQKLFFYFAPEPQNCNSEHHFLLSFDTSNNVNSNCSEAAQIIAS